MVQEAMQVELNSDATPYGRNISLNDNKIGLKMFRNTFIRNTKYKEEKFLIQKPLCSPRASKHGM
jgi:hypothetical protein